MNNQSQKDGAATLMGVLTTLFFGLALLFLGIFIYQLGYSAASQPAPATSMIGIADNVTASGTISTAFGNVEYICDGNYCTTLCGMGGQPQCPTSTDTESAQVNQCPYDTCALAPQVAPTSTEWSCAEKLNTWTPYSVQTTGTSTPESEGYNDCTQIN